MLGDLPSDPALDYIDAHKEPHTARLLKLLKQPSVSPTGEGVVECAHLLAKMFEEIGCPQPELIETPGNPVVYGEIPGSGPKTLLVYLMTGRYDRRDEPPGRPRAGADQSRGDELERTVGHVLERARSDPLDTKGASCDRKAHR